MAPVAAKRNPTSGSSNFGHKIPGVSSNSRSSSKRIHCFPRVTPALSPVCATFLPTRILINVLFPTFGIPTIMQRMVCFRMPFLAIRSRFSAVTSIKASFNLAISCFLPTVALNANALHCCCSLKCLTQYAVRCGSAKSSLFKITTRGLPSTSLSSRGFLLLIGKRASTNSMTTSTSLIWS